jgi:hypothetical protein
MENMTLTERFFNRNNISRMIGRINGSLRIFAFCHTKKLPDFLIDNETRKVMLDFIKIKGTNLLLPITVNSTIWLRILNELDDSNLKKCLQYEKWPYQQRFELMGGLQGIPYPEHTLCEYLKKSFHFWDNPGKKVSISERVLEITQTEDLKKLIKEVQVVTLSEEYKSQAVHIF